MMIWIVGIVLLLWLVLLTAAVVATQSDNDSLRDRLYHIENEEHAAELLKQAEEYGANDFYYYEGKICVGNWPHRSSWSLWHFEHSKLRELRADYLEAKVAECCPPKKAKKK